MKVASLLKLLALVPTVLSCDPLSTTCPGDKALATSFKEEFKKKSPYFDIVKPDGVSFGEDGLELKLAKKLANPTLQSNFYIMFGKVEVTLQAAEGTGIISSFFLQSDDLDEIDIELFGGDGYQFQSNYFSKGDTTTYTRGEYHATSSNPLQNFHTYTLDWTKDSLSWALDGEVVRTLYANNPQGYPQSPMFLKMGIWAGGDPSNEEGTIEWAGGLTDYSKMPFSMYVKSLIVTDYSTGDKYEYSNQSGDWTSIKAVNGKVNGRQEQADEDFKTLQDGGYVGTSYKGSDAASSSTKYSSLSVSPSSTSSSTSSSKVSSNASSSSSSSVRSKSSASSSSSSTSKHSTTTSPVSSSSNSHQASTSKLNDTSITSNASSNSNSTPSKSTSSNSNSMPSKSAPSSQNSVTAESSGSIIVSSLALIISSIISYIF